MKYQWSRVSKSNPCQVCNHTDWCTHSHLGACCMRIESKTPMHNGGWLHRLGEKVAAWVEKPKPPEPEINAEQIVTSWDEATDPLQLSDFAGTLGVSYDSLRALQCCRSQSHHAWAFPMRDGDSRIVGIRLRYDNGEKRAVRGSRSGIFIPMLSAQITCWIAEGPTDCAALLSLGLYSIGRPSCSGGTRQIWLALRERKVRKVVIVADNDQDKHRPDGERYNPGFDGAVRLADEIGLPTCVIIPPAKDIREYVTMGGTSEFLKGTVESTLWNQPRKNQQPTP